MSDYDDLEESEQNAEQAMEGDANLQLDLLAPESAPAPISTQGIEDAAETLKGEKLAPAINQKIEDFGEILEGAAKHKYTLNETLGTSTLATQKLSEAFPQPDYAKLAAEGIGAEELALVSLLRGQIGPKPRRQYKLARWIEKVDQHKKVAGWVLRGDLSAREYISGGQSDGFEGRSMLSRQDAEAMLAFVSIASTIPPDQIKHLGAYQIDHHFYQLFMGEKNKHKFKVSVKGEGDRYFDSAQQAAEHITGRLSEPSAPKAGLAKFDVYKMRGEKDVIIGKKVGRNYIDLVRVPDGKAARELLFDPVENKKLVELLKQKKAVSDHRRLSHNPRVGKDYRNGADITPEEFGDMFQLRGVQWGNWVSQEKRQDDINNAWDGLHDLSEVLKIPPAALSLNGELGLAFGARGRSGASAHYEPDERVINLTKKNGSGSLAHEWLHALDDYFGRAEGVADYITNHERKKRGYKDTQWADLSDDDFTVRAEIYKAFKSIVAIAAEKTNDSSLLSRSIELDKRRSKEYFSKNIELAARSFESYVVEKLRMQGHESDYLVSVTSKDAWDKSEEITRPGEQSTYPYPMQEELPKVVEAFDHLFETISVGSKAENNKLYRVSHDVHVKGGGMSPEAAMRCVEDFLSEYKGADQGLNIRVCPEWQVEGYAEGSTVLGSFDKSSNTLELVAANHACKEDLLKTLRHELIGHKGFELLGESRKNQVIQDIIANAEMSPSLSPIWRSIKESYPRAGKEMLAKELIAKVAEMDHHPKQDKWFQKVITVIANAFAKIGLVPISKTTDLDTVKELVRELADGFKTQKVVNSIPEMSEVEKSPTQSMTREKSNDQVFDLHSLSM